MPSSYNPGGGIGGTTGTTDNAIFVADGTSGNKGKGTVVTIAPTTGAIAFNTDIGALQFGAAKDAVLSRGGPDILEQKRGANAQTLNVYSTFTDTGNYGRVSTHWDGTGFLVEPQTNGTGNIGYIIFGNLNLCQTYLDGTSVTIRSGTTITLNGGNVLFGTDNTYDIGASGATRPRTIYAATSVLAPNIPVVDTGWTANADGGSKSAVVPSSATLATIQTGLNLAVAGAGDALAATAAKVKAIEAALVALLLPNA